MKVIALDFETSGLTPGVHAPVSLGVALMEGPEVLASEEWKIGPPMKDGKITRAYDVVALEISGCSWTSIKRAAPPSEICRNVMEWSRVNAAQDLPVVAFNAPFDFAWYSDLLFLGGSWNQVERRFQTFLPPFYGPWQCARLMAVSRIDCAGYSLDLVSKHFGLSRSSEKHGALEDAILAGRIFHALGEMTAAKGGEAA